MRRNRIPHCLIFAIAVICAGGVTPATAAPAGEAVSGETGADAVALAIREEAGSSLKRFYAERGFRPLWAPGGKIGRQADTLIGFLKSAELDGLKPSA
jgi:hypothetical protein